MARQETVREGETVYLLGYDVEYLIRPRLVSYLVLLLLLLLRELLLLEVLLVVSIPYTKGSYVMRSVFKHHRDYLLFLQSRQCR